jgi:hypothetical protein
LPEDRYKDFRKVVFEEKAIFLGKDKIKYILSCEKICIECCSPFYSLSCLLRRKTNLDFYIFNLDYNLLVYNDSKFDLLRHQERGVLIEMEFRD